MKTNKPPSCFRAFDAGHGSRNACELRWNGGPRRNPVAATRPTALRSRSGFSVVELVLVVVILGVVLSVALPGLLRAKDSAAAVNCKNNLRQIGIAVTGYVEVWGNFPAGRKNALVDGKLNCRSAHVELLPFLDQSNLATTFSGDTEIPPENSIPNSIAILTFICIASPGSGQLASTSNYVFNSGTTTAVSLRNPLGIVVDGVFFENSALRPAQIEDGMSNTIAVSETLPWPMDASRTRSLPAIDPGVVRAATKINGVEYQQLQNYDAQCLNSAQLAVRRGLGWAVGVGGGALYNHIRTPNSSTVDCEFGNAGSAETVQLSAAVSYDFAARSRHPGGVNVCNCDGSVRLIRNDIDPTVWKWLGSRDDGEIIEQF